MGGADNADSCPRGCPGAALVRLRGRPVSKALALQLSSASIPSSSPASSPGSSTPSRLRLPLPPSANDYWTIGRRRKKGRRRKNACLVLTKEARRYKASVLLRGKIAGAKPVSGPVELRLVVHFRDRRSDLSNRIKVLEDALQGVSYLNDKQVHRLVAERGEDCETPFVEVEVAAYNQANDSKGGVGQ